MSYGYIYVITNKINGKRYVGKTTNTIEWRWKQHLSSSLGKKLSDNCTIHKAIRKYGKENFTIEQIDIANSEEDINEKERFWIKKLDTFKKEYNETLGGEGITLIDSDLVYETYMNTGNKMIKDTAEILEINRGTVSKKLRKYGIVYKEGQPRQFDYEKVVKLYLEYKSRQKVADLLNCSISVVTDACAAYNINMREVGSKNKWDKQKKKVKKYDKETEELIKEYNSIAEAAEDIDNNTYNLTSKRNSISAVCRNKRKTAYGFKWSFA